MSWCRNRHRYDNTCESKPWLKWPSSILDSKGKASKLSWQWKCKRVQQNKCQKLEIERQNKSQRKWCPKVITFFRSRGASTILLKSRFKSRNLNLYSNTSRINLRRKLIVALFRSRTSEKILGQYQATSQLCPTYFVLFFPAIFRSYYCVLDIKEFLPLKCSLTPTETGRYNEITKTAQSFVDLPLNIKCVNSVMGKHHEQWEIVL